jgi:hypothetical protein
MKLISDTTRQRIRFSTLMRSLYENRYQQRLLTNQGPGTPSQRLRTFREPFIEALDTSALAHSRFPDRELSQEFTPQSPKPSATLLQSTAGLSGLMPFSALELEKRDGPLPASFTELKPLCPLAKPSPQLNTTLESTERSSCRSSRSRRWMRWSDGVDSDRELVNLKLGSLPI